MGERPGPTRSTVGLVLVCFCFQLLIVWCGVIVADARQRTPAILAQALDPERIKLRLTDFPNGRLDLLLAVQDPGFREHAGVDLHRTTTVTQALARYLYFDRYERSIPAKLRQTLIAAFALDPLVAKSDQLLIFVNTVYLGRLGERQVYGFAEAAQAYFGKSLSELSGDEYLSLLAMLDAPNGFNVATQRAANMERVERIKLLLAKRPDSWP